MSNVPPPPPGMPPPPNMPPPPPNMPPPPQGGMFVAGPTAPSGQPLASAGLRIAARLIEFVLSIIVGLVLTAIFVSSTARKGVGGFGGTFNIGVILLSLVFGWLIEAGLTATLGGSLGKLILGMRVVNASDGSTPVSWMTATIRWAVPGAFSIVPILGGLASIVVLLVSLIFLFTDKLRQTVSDKVAKTLVVKPN